MMIQLLRVSVKPCSVCDGHQMCPRVSCHQDVGNTLGRVQPQVPRYKGEFSLADGSMDDVPVCHEFSFAVFQ